MKKSILFASIFFTSLSFSIPSYAAEFQKEGEVDNRYIESANRELSSIPVQIMEKLESDGWNLYVSEYDLGDTYDNGFKEITAGITNFKDHTIRVRDYDRGIWLSVIHEVGHAVDFEPGIGMISNQSEFREIFEIEKETFVSSRSIGDGNEYRNSTEYFAEAFSEYFVNRESLYVCAPLTYDFIENRACTCAGVYGADDFIYPSEE